MDARPDEQIPPPGMRRFELIPHSYDDVLGYVEDANGIMDRTKIPAEERAELRVALVGYLGAKQVQIIPVDEAVIEQQNAQKAQAAAQAAMRSGIAPGMILPNSPPGMRR